MGLHCLGGSARRRVVRVFVWNLRTSLLISLFWWYFSWYVGVKGLEVGVDVVASISQRDTPDFEFVERLTTSSNVNTWCPLRSATVRVSLESFRISWSMELCSSNTVWTCFSNFEVNFVEVDLS